MKKSIKNILIIPSLLIVLIVFIYVFRLFPYIAQYTTGYVIDFKEINLLKGEIKGLYIFGKEIDLRASQIIITKPIALLSESYPTDIIVKEPIIHLTSLPDNKSDINFLRRLPNVKFLNIEKGTLIYSKKDIPYELKLEDIKIQLKDYLTNKGGVIDYEFSFKIFDTLNNVISSIGSLKGSTSLINTTKDLHMKGSFIISMEFIKSDSLLLSDLKASGHFVYDKKILTLHNLSCISKEMSLKEHKLSFQNISLNSNMVFDTESLSIVMTRLNGKVSPIGNFTGNLSLQLSKDYPFKSELLLNQIDIKRLYELFQPFIDKDIQDEWKLEGFGTANLNIKGYIHESIPHISGIAIIDLQNTSFSSKDFLKAGQGIKGRIAIELQDPQALKKKSLINLQSRFSIHSGEYLFDNFYLNQGEKLVSAEIGVIYDMSNLLTVDIKTNLISTGQYEVKFSKTEHGWHIYTPLNSIQLDRFYEIILKDSLPSIYPFTKDMDLNGQLKFSLNGHLSKKHPSLLLWIDLQTDTLNIPFHNLSVKGFSMKSPFFINYNNDDFSNDKAQIQIVSLDYKGINVKDISIPLTASTNQLVLNENVKFELLNGMATLNRFQIGINEQRDFYIKTSIDLKGAKTSMLTDVLGFGPFGGTLDAKISELEIVGSKIYSDSFIQADLFGGKVDVTNLSGDFNVNTFGADITFKDIDLEKLTETIKIGKITGIVEGFLKDFQIQYGQAARFNLDIDSVKREGIRQTVSTDAVESISILGTGSEGIARLLSTGINQFFKEFPYSKIGIKCILDNDVFTIRGKIHEGGKEYLIRKGFLRGIDVINQNPDNQISFKDMQKRLNIIFEQK